jgi:GDP-4-dehydro-6-deoxy-D-mannose reductase
MTDEKGSAGSIPPPGARPEPPGATPRTAADSRWARRDLARLTRMVGGRPVLVTGASGFIGRWLSGQVAAAGVRVVTLSRRGGGRTGRGMAALRHDLAQAPDRLHARLERVQPGVVFHLAAPLPTGDDSHVSLVETALRQTHNLLDVCARLTRPPLVLVVSSSAVYGNGGRHPIAETRAPAPATMYGVSKLLVEALAMRATAATALRVIRVRPFNVIGPGQADSRVLARFASQVAEVAAGRRQPPIMTQGLGAWRDCIDVRDVVTALCAVAARGLSGQVYNVCTGHAVQVGELLDRLKALAHLPDLPVESTGDHGVDRSCGDDARLRALGWRRRYGLSASLRDVLVEWQARQR